MTECDRRIQLVSGRHIKFEISDTVFGDCLKLAFIELHRKRQKRFFLSSPFQLPRGEAKCKGDGDGNTCLLVERMPRDKNMIRIVALTEKIEPDVLPRCALMQCRDIIELLNMVSEGVYKVRRF